MTEIFATWWFEIKIKFLVHRELLLRLKSFIKFCVTDDRDSTGPSIKYVSTFFAIFDTPLQHESTFYTYPSALSPQFLTPPSLKCSDLLYGRPQRCMVTWSLSLTSNMFPLTDAHKSIMCATVYIVHHIVRLKLLHWVDNASSVLCSNTTR